ncbi:MAG: TMEM43 family protein [Candidatus Riflebacteria bacterium]|nr:TMEM43 family protein [Candidatus Riflebacteria bacterium]
MSDSFTEVTEKSWFGRLKDAFFGVIFGIILAVGSVVLLFWNEGRAVETYKTLVEGASNVISVLAEKLEQSNEGKLVHLKGQATTDETLSDSDFNVSAKALRLDRNVKMYQWTEVKSEKEEKKIGGGTNKIVTYDYRKEWLEELKPSSNFKKQDGHSNPSEMPYHQLRLVAKNVKLGAFTLTDSLVQSLSNFEKLPVGELPTVSPATAVGSGTAASGTSAAGVSKPAMTPADGGLYLGMNPREPQVGDVKVEFSQVKPQAVSIVAKQVGSSFGPYKTQAGGVIEMIRPGELTADAMFAAAQEENTIITWVARIGGFILMAIGFALVLSPISVVFDVLPFLGNIAETGVSFIAFFMAAFCSLATIGTAWIIYRPLIGIILFVIAFGALAGLASMRKTGKTVSAAS